VKRRYSKTFFENPYLQESERRLSSALVMDEARQKWRAGHWRAKREDLQVEREELAGQAAPVGTEGEKAPAPARFKLDVKRDLAGGAISLASLRELNYSPAYRPRGSLDEISEHKVAPMSTLSRYDVLAGELEAPPEDLSFLSDAQRRLDRDKAKGEQRDGSLRLDTRRLPTSVDERRSKLISLLPGEDESQLEQIITDTKRRRLREDAELGRISKRSKEETEQAAAMKKVKPRKKVQYDHDDPLEAYYARTSGSRLERLPEQTGMSQNTQALPEFESITRRWSEIHSPQPTWSEVADHTDSNIPRDADRPGEREPRYIRDDMYNPNRPYRTLDGRPPRERVRSKEAGEFKNEYLHDEGIDSKRVREIMEKEYRGRWIPPEFFSDDELVTQWFQQYNRGALSGEDFVHWAYRQRSMAEQARQSAAAAEQAELLRRRREREEAERRRRDEEAFERARRREEEQRVEQARQLGYRQGQRMRREEIEMERGRERMRQPRYGSRSPERDPYARSRGWQQEGDPRRAARNDPRQSGRMSTADYGEEGAAFYDNSRRRRRGRD